MHRTHWPQSHSACPTPGAAGGARALSSTAPEASSCQRGASLYKQGFGAVAREAESPAQATEPTRIFLRLNFPSAGCCLSPVVESELRSIGRLRKSVQHKHTASPPRSPDTPAALHWSASTRVQQRRMPQSPATIGRPPWGSRGGVACAVAGRKLRCARCRLHSLHMHTMRRSIFFEALSKVLGRCLRHAARPATSSSKLLAMSFSRWRPASKTQPAEIQRSMIHAFIRCVFTFQSYPSTRTSPSHSRYVACLLPLSWWLPCVLHPAFCGAKSGGKIQNQPKEKHSKASWCNDAAWLCWRRRRGDQIEVRQVHFTKRLPRHPAEQHGELDHTP